MNKLFSGGVNTTLTLFLVGTYVVLLRTDSIHGTLIELTGSWGAILLPMTVILSLKIAINFAKSYAITVIVASGLTIQAAFSGIMSLWSIRLALLFNPMAGDIAFDYYFAMDDVRVAGGYLGRIVANLTIDVLYRFPSVLAMDTYEALGVGMAGVGLVIIGVVCVAFLFLPNGRTGRSGRTRNGNTGDVVNIVNR